MKQKQITLTQVWKWYSLPFRLMIVSYFPVIVAALLWEQGVISLTVSRGIGMTSLLISSGFFTWWIAHKLRSICLKNRNRTAYSPSFSN